MGRINKKKILNTKNKPIITANQSNIFMTSGNLSHLFLGWPTFIIHYFKRNNKLALNFISQGKGLIKFVF